MLIRPSERPLLLLCACEGRDGTERKERGVPAFPFPHLMAKRGVGRQKVNKGHRQEHPEPGFLKVFSEPTQHHHTNILIYLKIEIAIILPSCGHINVQLW